MPSASSQPVAGFPAPAVAADRHGATGPDLLTGVAVGVGPSRPDVLSLEDQQEIAAWHDARGLYDYVAIGTGSQFDFTTIIPTFLRSDMLGAPCAEAIKQAVKQANVQAESRIRTPDNADYVIAAGVAFQSVGNGVSPRHARAAIYEGRRAALAS